jgi:hypothetical protein
MYIKIRAGFRARGPVKTLLPPAAHRNHNRKGGEEEEEEEEEEKEELDQRPSKWSRNNHVSNNQDCRLIYTRRDRPQEVKMAQQEKESNKESKRKDLGKKSARQTIPLKRRSSQHSQ